jgi:hypothetical protein
MVEPRSDLDSPWKDALETYFQEFVAFFFPQVHADSEHWAELEASDNPFAVVVMAHLKAQETRRDDQQRQVWKLLLMRRLYERGYKRQDIVNLFHFNKVFRQGRNASCFAY